MGHWDIWTLGHGTLGHWDIIGTLHWDMGHWTMEDIGATAVCYCMIDHACLLLVLSCLVLLRCSLLCVSYHSTHRTYNGSTRTHAHPRSYGVYSSKWWQVLQSSHPWHVLLPPLDHSSQLLLVISSTACPCWPWCHPTPWW